MARPPVTVVALAAADRELTRGFLALLAGTLAPGDDVLLLGPGHDPKAAGSWRVRGPAQLAPPAEPGTVRDLVVVVDERAVPVGPWLDPLVTALAEPHVGAAASRSNIAAGDDLLVGVPYRPAEAQVHRAFVSSLAAGRFAERTRADRLGGPSLAVRRSTLEGAGGLASLLTADPVATLARRVATAGASLVVAEGSYLHHGGGPGGWRAACTPGRPSTARGCRPFVSACLITKDERQNLPRSLASIGGLADEIVVYDTGSTDGTCDVARSFGATVVEGFWDGDFSRARNEALARCRGQWVLWLDADEALACDDPAAVRRLLAELSSDAEALVVSIDNLRATLVSTAFTHPACRLFRRAYGQWTGRLHEQVTARAGTPRLSMSFADALRITHWGYLRTAIGDRHKGRRNIRSAFGDLTTDTELPWASRLLNLGRSYGLAGRTEEGLALDRAALAAAESPAVQRLALWCVIEALLALDRAAEALAEVARLRSLLQVPAMADALEGRALLALGRHEEALAALDRVEVGLDDDGYEHSPHGVAADRAGALAALGRHREAAAVLLAGLRASGGTDVPVGTLVDCLAAANLPLGELARATPPDRAVAFLDQVADLATATADRVLEAWYGTDPSPAVLATAAKAMVGHELVRRRAWSERLRANGLGHACPLVAAAARGTQPVGDRVVGAAVAATRFGDPRGRQAFGALCLQLPRRERAGVRRAVAAQAPSLLDAFDALAARTGSGPPDGGPAVAGAAEPRAVLVVDRKVASLRTAAVAAALRRHGHDVTLAHPEPTAPTGALLSALGVAVEGWDGTERDAGWREHLRAHVAASYARRPFDTVVVPADTAGAIGDLRRLLPAASLVVDVDDGTDTGGGGGGGTTATFHCDLALAATAAAPGGQVPTQVLPGSATSVLGPVASVPEGLRRGMCVVGDFRTAGDAAMRRWARVATTLARHQDVLTVAVVGDDPGGRFASALPGAVPVGALADPLPWLRAARLVLVASTGGAAHWLAGAAMAGTPALLVPTDDALLAGVAPAVLALADPSQASRWQRSAPVLDPRPALGRTDPLERLPAPFRRRAGGRTGTPSEVRRGCPPDLSPTAGGRMVVDLCWPYGGLPLEWLGPLRDFADEVRVTSSWARAHAVASGADPGAVRLAPVAVDTELFAPHERGRALATGKTTKVLFVGAASERDGVDALLECYLTAFTAGDDVSLVVHLVGYHDEGWADDVRRAARSGAGRAEVVVVDAGLPDDQRAGLYRACDLFVDPRRAPATLRTTLEAMASGLPVVALAQGPGRDLCDGRTGWLVGCSEVAADPAGLEVTPSPHGIWQLEPDRASLVAALRRAVDAPHDRLLKGLAARDRVSSRFAAPRPAGGEAGGQAAGTGAAPFDHRRDQGPSARAR